MNAKLRRDLVASLLVLTPLAAIYLLPPDTSLAEIRKTGSLTACLPDRYPPLVTGDAAKPGIEIELLQALAQRLDLKLAIATEPAMTRDFNPRNWRLTRAQCAVIGGGLVGSETTRGFLDTTPPYAESGWTLIARDPTADLAGKRVGVLTSLASLDRVALASALRAQQAEIMLVATGAELTAGLAEQRFQAAVTERLLAQSLAVPPGWQVTPLPGALGHVPLVLGLWKGDLTLKHALVGAFDSLDRAGTVAAIRNRYGITPLLAEEDGQQRLHHRSEQAIEQAEPGKRQHGEAGQQLQAAHRPG